MKANIFMEQNTEINLDTLKQKLDNKLKEYFPLKVRLVPTVYFSQEINKFVISIKRSVFFILQK